MTDKERVEKFKSHKIVINCQIKEEAEKFIKWCYKNDMEWINGKLNIGDIPWSDKTTCYKYGYDNTLGYANIDYYSDSHEIITYKDFFKEEEQTNIQFLLDSITAKDDSNCSLCALLYKLKYKKHCAIGDICAECEFNKISNCLKYLIKKHNKPIKITQFEYDMLSIRKEYDYGSYNDALENNLYFFELKEKGYFKNVDLKMTAKEILDNCEIENE